MISVVDSSQSGSSPISGHLATRRPLSKSEHVGESTPYNGISFASNRGGKLGSVCHLYKCTVCRGERTYKNDYDWKKHEKTHEFTYVCMPDGWLEIVGEDKKCVLCNAPDPDEQHSSTHDVHECQYTCKRRGQLTKHLNTCHGVSNIALGRTLADQWLRSIGRQFWSCGFCINLFSNLLERLKHIDAEHFRRHQSSSEWDMTNVISGLLRQPGVYEAFKEQMIAYYGWKFPETIWDGSKLGALQLNLELGPSEKRSAMSLARSAFDLCEIRGAYEWNERIDLGGDRHEIDGSGSASSYDRRGLDSMASPTTLPQATEAMLWHAKNTHVDSRSGDGYARGQMPTSSDLVPAGKSTTLAHNEASRLYPGVALTPSADFNFDFAEPSNGHGEAKSTYSMFYPERGTGGLENI